MISNAAYVLFCFSVGFIAMVALKLCLHFALKHPWVALWPQEWE